MNEKVSLFVINANYPFGKTETFLENEIKFISPYFDKIYLFPLNYPSKDFTLREVPENVIYHSVLLDKLHYKRIIKFIFRFSPITEYLKDLLMLVQSGEGRYFNKLKGWAISLLVDRAFYKSNQYNYIKNNIKQNDILYFYWGGARSRFAKNFNHPKTFIRVHGRELDFPRNSNYIVLFKNTFTVESTFLAISNKVKKQILSYFPKNIVKVNRLGTFDMGIGPLDSSKKNIRIVTCSNVIPLKRVHLVVEALRKINNIEVEWIHFGDGILFSQLNLLAKSLNQNITYIFKGRVTNDVVLDFYKNNQVDLFINVSTAEGVPVSIMEAFSFGIPCFATNVGATSELLNNNNGVLVDKDFSINELILCIKNCNTEQFRLKRIEARNTWDKYCNADKNYLQLINLLYNMKIAEKPLSKNTN